MYFAQFMKDLRKEKSLTQTEIANILDISAQSIKKIENGTTKFPSKTLLEKLSNYLSQLPIEIASKIIFGDDDYDRDETGYLSNRYLAYKYLDGWNLDQVPIWLNYKTDSICFAGKISKRREPKNTSIIIEFSEFEVAMEKEFNIDDAYNVLAIIMTVVVQSEESFRRVEVLFDISQYNESLAFQILENLKIHHLPIDMVLILFDPDYGTICNEAIKKKN